MTLADLLTDLAARGALPPGGRPRRPPCATWPLPSASQPGAVPRGRRLPGSSDVGGRAGDPLPARWRRRADHQRVHQAQHPQRSPQGLSPGRGHGLLPAPLPRACLTKPRREAFRRQQQATTPYRRPIGTRHPRHYGLPQAQWPPDIAAGLADLPGQVWRAHPGDDVPELCAPAGDLYGLSASISAAARPPGTSSLMWRSSRRLCAGTGHGWGASISTQGARRGA